MNRRDFLQNSLAGVVAGHSASAQGNPTPGSGKSSPELIDFGFAFAPPHRMTVGRPGASEKTLLDLNPGSLTIAWSYQDLRHTPLAIFKTPHVDWHVKLTPLLDDKSSFQSTWTRAEKFLPVLQNVYQQAAGSIQLEVAGGATAALVRVAATNSDTRAHSFAVRCEVMGNWVANNPAWMTPNEDPDALVACQGERPDRVLMFGVSAQKILAGRKTVTLEWTLGPGESRTGWIVRPYEAFQGTLPALRAFNWEHEFQAGKTEWRELLGRATQMSIPDKGVENALYACLGDLFIMREALADGYVGTTCGTEGYRSTNPFEPCLAAIALDQFGYHDTAADGLRVHLDMQEPSGEWSDPKGWAHHMWGASGLKSWAAMEHFQLTGDVPYLRTVYPRFLASSRWQALQRKKAAVSADAATKGLMPRGMGDAGLMNGSDYFGVFYPHNILAVFADKLSFQAAETLGLQADKSELQSIFEPALRDLKASLAVGAIDDSGFRWIPDSPGNRTGSRWGALYTIFPAQLLDPKDPLVTGTFRKIESAISPGGQPIHTGWMEDGAWVGITIDNVAEAHLALGRGDAAIAYLYSSLNHGTPLFTWCEERGLEPGSKKTSGDRQHLWTPVAVVRFLRDALVFEQDGNLHFAIASARSWLLPGKVIEVKDAPTHFGTTSYRMESELERNVIRVRISPPTRNPPHQIVLHVRHPRKAPMQSLKINGVNSASFDKEQEVIHLPYSAGDSELEVGF